MLLQYFSSALRRNQEFDIPELKKKELKSIIAFADLSLMRKIQIKYFFASVTHLTGGNGANILH